MNIFYQIKNNLKYLLIIIVTIFSLSFIWTCNAADDLLYKITEPARYNWTIIDMGTNVDSVWTYVFEWRTEVNWDNIDFDPNTKVLEQKAPMVVKITRLILQIIIAISVTMILYNWMMYIIQTWNGKEGKSLVKNIVYIVVWILIALFSVIIINIIQSVPNTLKEELGSDGISQSEQNAEQA